MKLTGESKFLLIMLLITLVIVGIAVVVFTRPAPTLTRQDLILNTSYTKGNPQASVYLVEFSDYQCPACKAVNPVIDQLMEKYKDKLLFAYRHFPLDQHPLSQEAAEAAEVAGVNGKFWEMSDLLFSHQDTLTEQDFLTFAKQLGIDESSMSSALADHTYEQKVLEDRAAGEQFGVDSTPSFYLNGKKLELTTFDDITKAVSEQLD